MCNNTQQQHTIMKVHQKDTWITGVESNNTIFHANMLIRKVK